jgi:hypothetical protein
LREPGWRRSGARFGAYRGDNLPARVVEVHLTAGQLAIEAQNLTLLILLVVSAAVAVLVGLIRGKGIAPNEWHHSSDMQKPYPIAPSIARCRANRKPAQISCSSIA